MSKFLLPKYKNISPSLLDPIPKSQMDDVIKELRASQTRGKLDVRGSMGLPENVAKFDIITFDNEAILMLEALDAPFIAIATKELIFDIKNPQYRAYLSRPIGPLEVAIVKKLQGQDGAAGTDGRRGSDGGGNGGPGGHGGSGGNATPGLTKQIPPIYLFVQDIKFGATGTPEKQYFNLHFPGFPGGDGGIGGRGGNGGAGGNGQNGVPGGFDCKSGAGDGGNGGNAGTGGRGGDAADGGNGGSLYLFAPDAGVFNFSTGNIEGGAAGKPGRGGTAGVPGAGGDGGAPVGWCTGHGRDGRRGNPAVPLTEGDGIRAVPGVRGIQVARSRNNSDLF